MRRLFFAVWPSPEACSQLAQCAAAALTGARGRLVGHADWHVTLCFLGSVDEQWLTPLCERSAQVIAPAFRLSIDRLELWRRPRVLVASASQAPEAATVLVEALKATVLGLGLSCDPKPWRPHLTLARSVSGHHDNGERLRDQALPRAVSLAVDSFRLAESRHVEGRRYQSLASWPLQSAR